MYTKILAFIDAFKSRFCSNSQNILNLSNINSFYDQMFLLYRGNAQKGCKKQLMLFNIQY